ncbi:CU044_5270 family protein [Streptomyces sp. NPDC098781]|uniref:CU044_5270 family protein n=1 Tax=Streptomyces sp. NPDC098781 TaxID=3366097 RepID=UPI0038016958
MNTNPRRRDRQAEFQDLAELLPAPAHPVLPQGRHHVLREHLMEQITDEASRQQSDAPRTSPSTSPSVPVPRRPGRRLALVAAPLALVAVVGLGAVAVDLSQDDGASTGVTAVQHREAVRLLDRIALAAADGPEVTVRDGQYVYFKSQGDSSIWGGPTTPVRNSDGDVTRMEVYKGNVQSEEWQPVNGKGDGLRRLVGLTPSGEPDPSHKDDISMSGVPYLTFRQLQALPTDPDALLKKLRSGSGVSESRVTETVFENVGVILDQATLLPDLSAALYRAVAELPDVHVVENVKDGAGRTGVGLTYTSKGSSGGTNATWVFDSKSLTYLGTSKSALLDVGVVDGKGETDSRSS